MMVIWKYQLKLTELQSIAMPSGATILSVAEQNESLCLWAMVDPKMIIKQQRHIEIFGTGNPITTVRHRKFIGTVVTDPFVWHVFEVV